jgi:hypothetical protein
MRNLHHHLLLLAWAACLPLAAQPTKGRAEIHVPNGRSIHHPRNAEARQELMRLAVVDAIDRVAPVEVRSRVHHAVREDRTGARRYRFHESFEQVIQQRTDVVWRRVGEYGFQRDPERPHWWICIVNGVVELPEVAAASPAAKHAEEPLLVASRKGARVWTFPVWSAKVPPVGGVFEGHRTGRAGPTGLVVVDRSSASEARALVVQGHYTLRPGDELVAVDHGLLRGGVQLRVGQGAARTAPLEGTGSQASVNSIALDFFEQGLLHRWELSLGFEAMGLMAGDSLQGHGFFARVGIIRPLAIVPGALSLRPGLLGGFGVEDDHAYMSEGRGVLLADAQAELAVHLGALQLTAGVRWRGITGTGAYGGTMYCVGAWLDLYRISGLILEDRDRPMVGRSLFLMRDLLNLP